MIESCKHWFAMRSPRDQIALLVLALALLVYLVLRGVFMPLQSAVDAADDRVSAARAGLGRVKALAAELQTARSGAARAVNDGNLAALVDRMAVESGMVINTLEPAADGQSLSLSLEEAATLALLDWLQRIEDSNLRVQTLAIMPGAGDRVSARIQVGRP